MWVSKTLLYADIKCTRENDNYDRSPRREEVRGEILVERVFVEIEASWRGSRRGEKLFVERLLRGEKRSAERGFKERLSP